MQQPTRRPSDRRRTDREFRQLTRGLRPPTPIVRRWRAGPTDATDVHITPHGDRRSAATVAAAAGALVLAIVGVVTGQPHLAVAMALVGFAGCALLGSDQARTYLTVADDGRVELGNGVHRRTTTVPAVAVARISVPRIPTRSRWTLRRAGGELLLHTGQHLPVRALAYDPSREVDHDRAVYLARSAVRAFEAAGAVLDTRRV
ncbi:MAG: hypothetical protein KY461_11275 [Actinobacteria bacterium]|nr:hypothetical protein [Actinomycetota bacterium]